MATQARKSATKKTTERPRKRRSRRRRREGGEEGHGQAAGPQGGKGRQAGDQEGGHEENGHKAVAKKTVARKPVAKKATAKAHDETRGRAGEACRQGTCKGSDPQAARSTAKKTPRPARKPRGITPEQALANTRALLEAKQAHDREPPPWQSLETPGGMRHHRASSPTKRGSRPTNSMPAKAGCRRSKAASVPRTATNRESAMPDDAMAKAQLPPLPAIVHDQAARRSPPWSMASRRNSNTCWASTRSPSPTPACRPRSAVAAWPVRWSMPRSNSPVVPG